MKEKIKILDLETRPSQETDLLQLSDDELNRVMGGHHISRHHGMIMIIMEDLDSI